MKALIVILTVLFVLICVALVVTVLLQEGKSAGLGTLAGMNNDTYWSKHKSRTLEGKLEKTTKYMVAAFMVIALLLNILN